MEKTIAEISEIINGKVVGDSQKLIKAIKSIEDANEDDLTFANDAYLKNINEFKAGVVIVSKEIKDTKKNLIVVSEPKAAFVKLLTLFYHKKIEDFTIDKTAVIHDKELLSNKVKIMPYAYLGKNVKVGEDTIIYPFTYIGDNVSIGDNCEIYPNVVIHDNCVVGNNVVIRANAVIGGEGFGFLTKNGKHEHIPQVGNVLIEDNVEIGSNTTIDNATTESTIIKNGTKIDNLVHIAHNVEIGEDCFVIAQTGIAGSAKIGNNVILAGQTGVAGHLKVCDGTSFAGRSGIIGNITKPGTYAGFPAREHRVWLKQEALLNKLPSLYKEIKELKNKLLELEKK